MRKIVDETYAEIFIYQDNKEDIGEEDEVDDIKYEDVPTTVEKKFQQDMLRRKSQYREEKQRQALAPYAFPV